ncbi:Nucleolar GTP-binding protein 1-like [Oopsacas minuta]|uniref:Nucleolar GTP-binding protein 1 n=1 Tax=Oopsacas minuta TaxID=111878 RepID=A0AAV7K9P6_9METZ|nr:Nucleolar GTP-binding protein 1-like [Oopsacas minuta]
MTQYNFKQLPIVPNAKDFIDIVLSKTHRKTPTVVHRHFKISRIRHFYMRKVKFTQQNYHDKLQQIVDAFPKLDAVHPFYSDLMNVLYDRDHYKIALGQLNKAKHLVDNLARDYTRLLKYADSLYRCKQLKIAALGRMSTLMKRQTKSLEYLEQVRQHLSRLPSIDPNTRTIIISGFPNVGKSSFINKVTRADVDVQPYAFTTKSLFVGHMDYEYLRWQVIDTPGLLDQTLDHRSTIEMQAITALIHLRAGILYIMDLSEQCGHTLEEQLKLFRNIQPVFKGKPLIICLNKMDVLRPEDLSQEKQEVLNTLREEGLTLIAMSTLTEEGVMEVRREICDLLLAERVDYKMQGKRAGDILNRLYVAMPQMRNDKERPPCIPQSVLDRRARQKDGEVEIRPKKKLLREIEQEEREEYACDLRQHWKLDNDEEKYDFIPEVWNGHNVYDFVDPDILQQLENLEREEGMREQSGFYNSDSDMEDDTSRENHILAEKIRDKRNILIQERRVRKSSSNKSKLPDAVMRKARSKSARRSTTPGIRGEDAMDTGRSLSTGAARSRSRSMPRNEEGVMNPVVKKAANKRAKRNIRNMTRRVHTAGEADRRIVVKRPKHLLAGKSKMGKSWRR